MSGKTTQFGGKYGSDDTVDDIYKFFESKQSPSMSAITEFWRGRTSAGEDFDLLNAISTRSIPIMMQDLWELYQEDPKYMLLIVPAILGMGVQVQNFTNTRQRKSKSSGIRPVKPVRPTRISPVRPYR